MAENTTDLDAVMQAAERLRRNDYGYRLVGEPSQFEDDRHTLTAFALSILPKGKRPVAMETPADGQTVWTVYNDQVQKSRIKVSKNMPFVEVEDTSQDYWRPITDQRAFATEAEARDELEHVLFDDYCERRREARFAS